MRVQGHSFVQHDEEAWPFVVAVGKQVGGPRKSSCNCRETVLVALDVGAWLDVGSARMQAVAGGTQGLHKTADAEAYHAGTQAAGDHTHAPEEIAGAAATVGLLYETVDIGYEELQSVNSHTLRECVDERTPGSPAPGVGTRESPSAQIGRAHV